MEPVVNRQLRKEPYGARPDGSFFSRRGCGTAAKLVTFKDAGNYITSLPKAEQNTKAWQTATQTLLLVAEHSSGVTPYACATPITVASSGFGFVCGARVGPDTFTPGN